MGAGLENYDFSYNIVSEIYIIIIIIIIKENLSFNEIGVGAPSRRNVSIKISMN